jgi:monofunctional biosynthetic peptidoglycan transglycosylase
VQATASTRAQIERGMAQKVLRAGRGWRAARRVGLLLALLALVGAADLTLTWWRYRGPIAALASGTPTTTAYMRRELTAHGPQQPVVWTALDDVSPVAVCAVLAAEDWLFFHHGSLDWDSQRLVFTKLLHADLSAGGSTITQQLARNLFLGPDRTPRRKAREYVLAYMLSQAVPKTRQLELYLNLVEWGPGVWGIGAASRHWFGKVPNELTPTEAVLLATILPAPHRGLAYAGTPTARRAQEKAVDWLWHTTLLDNIERGATSARLRLWGIYVAAGHDPIEARALVEQEFGPEPGADGAAQARRRAAASRCAEGRSSGDIPDDGGKDATVVESRRLAPR